VNKVKWISNCLLFLLFLSLLTLDVEAIPAFARQLGVKCQTCHFPNPPRLNNVGMTFRRMGYRLPDADENGNFILKTPSTDLATGFASVIAELEAEVEKAAADPTENRANLKLGEVEVFSAHALGPRLSYQGMFVLRNENGEAELETADVQYNVGTDTDAVLLRGGQLQTLWWQKVGHERLTDSTPLALAHGAAPPIGSFHGFALASIQSAAEITYTHNSLHEGSLSSTILTAMVLNGVNGEGEASSSRSGSGFDFLAQGYHLFGGDNTVGAFYYRGNTRFHGEHEGEEMNLAPLGLFRTFSEEPVDEEEAPIFKDTFDRFGIVGNYLIQQRLDFVAGVVIGKDDSTELEATIDNRGWFIEGDVSLKDRWSVSYRHDELDPNTDFSGDTVRADTISTRYQPMDYLLLTIEYQSLRTEEEDDYHVVGVVHFVF
jgi:hypothetical protein